MKEREKKDWYKALRRNILLRKLQSRETEHRRNSRKASSALSNIPRYRNGEGTDFFFLINYLCSETLQSVSQR